MTYEADFTYNLIIRRDGEMAVRCFDDLGAALVSAYREAYPAVSCDDAEKALNGGGFFREPNWRDEAERLADVLRPRGVGLLMAFDPYAPPVPGVREIDALARFAPSMSRDVNVAELIRAASERRTLADVWLCTWANGGVDVRMPHDASGDIPHAAVEPVKAWYSHTPLIRGEKAVALVDQLEVAGLSRQTVAEFFGIAPKAKAVRPSSPAKPSGGVGRSL